ncbi:SMP-30/gluconolactonase/LRE family protein [Acetobacter papayae]|uniref:SMP-30/gluconolactonase/LRE family protein n=1 Tax=Acetobacter papayae TaxID=1076592 RepID=UPI000685816E|nr:L-dopachrome tautomerase-related protein [Acetobacter papayae]
MPDTAPRRRFSRRPATRRLGILAAALACLATGPQAWALHMPKESELGPQALTPFMQSSDHIWDAVLPLPDGRMVLEAPAWLGNSGPQLFIRTPDGATAPWPAAMWNTAQSSSAPDAPTQEAAAKPIIAAAGLTRTAQGTLWVLDSGVPQREQPPKAAPRLLEIDPTNNAVVRSVPIQADALQPGSILSGVAVHEHTAYVPDSGVGAILVVDLDTGISRRFLDRHPALTATRPIMTPQGPLHHPNGGLVAMDASMIAVSPDGSWIVVQPPGGYLSRIDTGIFNDPHITPAAFEESVTQWFKTPSLGGLVIDSDGTLYWSDITTGSIQSYTTGRIPRRLITDDRLRWPTTPGLDGKGHLYVTASQVDQSGAFGGAPSMNWPVTLYQLTLPTTPPTH